MSESRIGEKNYLSKPVINIETKEEYCNLRELSEEIEQNYYNLWAQLTNKKGRKNKTPFVFKEDYEKGIINCLDDSKTILSNWEKLIDTSTGKIYDNKRECARDIGICPSKLLRMLRGYYTIKGKKYPYKNTTKIEYYNGL